MVELLQLTLDAAVAPAGVVGGHAEDEGADRPHQAGSPDALAGVGPLRGDQLTVPAQDGVGGDDAGDLTQQLAAEGVAPRCESAPLVIRQSKTLAAHLLLEDAVLLDEVGDGVGLLVVDEACEGDEE